MLAAAVLKAGAVPRPGGGKTVPEVENGVEDDEDCFGSAPFDGADVVGGVLKGNAGPVDVLGALRNVGKDTVGVEASALTDEVPSEAGMVRVPRAGMA